MDKRRQWRTQEQELVARWNAAVARHQKVMAQAALAEGDAMREALVLAVNRAQAEIDAVRRQIARLKVEFNSGKRY